MLFMETRREIQ